MDFGATKNFLFPCHVRIVVEDYEAAFIGAAAIQISNGLLKPLTDLRI